MKKLLELSVDFFLFCFLLIILIVPLLVSFNLDPQLFVPKSKVAGVQDVQTDQQLPLTFEQNDQLDEQIKELSIEKKSNAYVVDVALDARGSFDQMFEFGTIRNDSTQPMAVDVRLYANQDALYGIVSKLHMEDNSYLLYNGSEFTDVHVTMEPHGKMPLQLELHSNFAVNYELPLKVQVKAKRQS